MVGIEEAYCNTVIEALLLANFALLESTIIDALQGTSAWGKGDTLGLDAIMSPSPPYSIFKVLDGDHKKVIVDVDRLEAFPNPSRYRGMLLVAISSNRWVIQLVQQYGHRALDFPDP